MASKSEVTFGSKLANGQEIATQLTTANTYQPPTRDLDLSVLNNQLSTLTDDNTRVADLTADYSAAVDARQRAYRKQPDSIAKLLSPIAAAVRSSYGKTSKEATNMAAMVKKMRSMKLKKAAAGSTEKVVSQSEASFGSVAKSFEDIVATLFTYSAYNPANVNVKMPALKAKAATLAPLSAAVTQAYSLLKTARDQRAADYKTMRALVQRIKDAVKSQYGNKSSEYAQLKSLKV